MSLILDIAAAVAFVIAAFLVSLALGFAATGAALWLVSYRIDEGNR